MGKAMGEAMGKRVGEAGGKGVGKGMGKSSKGAASHAPQPMGDGVSMGNHNAAPGSGMKYLGSKGDAYRP